MDWRKRNLIQNSDSSLSWAHGRLSWKEGRPEGRKHAQIRAVLHTLCGSANYCFETAPRGPGSHGHVLGDCSVQAKPSSGLPLMAVWLRCIRAHQCSLFCPLCIQTVFLPSGCLQICLLCSSSSVADSLNATCCTVCQDFFHLARLQAGGQSWCSC